MIWDEVFSERRWSRSGTRMGGYYGDEIRASEERCLLLELCIRRDEMVLEVDAGGCDGGDHVLQCGQLRSAGLDTGLA